MIEYLRFYLFIFALAISSCVLDNGDNDSTKQSDTSFPYQVELDIFGPFDSGLLPDTIENLDMYVGPKNILSEYGFIVYLVKIKNLTEDTFHLSMQIDSTLLLRMYDFYYCRDGSKHKYCYAGGNTRQFRYGNISSVLPPKKKRLYIMPVNINFLQIKSSLRNFGISSYGCIFPIVTEKSNKYKTMPFNGLSCNACYYIERSVEFKKRIDIDSFITDVNGSLFNSFNREEPDKFRPYQYFSYIQMMNGAFRNYARQIHEHYYTSLTEMIRNNQYDLDKHSIKMNENYSIEKSREAVDSFLFKEILN